MPTAISNHIEIHFDVPDSMISARTLADVANGIQQISDVVFEEAIKPGSQTEVYLCVPKEGCFEAIFMVVAPFAFGTIAGTVGKTFINSFIKNMIGYGLEEITEFTTTKLTDNLKKQLLVNYASSAISTYLEQNIQQVTYDHSFSKEFKRLEKGKNTVYKAITQDNRISRISFSEDLFIERVNFSEYTTNVDDDSSLEQFGFYEGEVQIISPVSLKDKSRRGWSGFFLAEGEPRIERTFEIDDENFRQYALSNNIRIAADDIARVQMIKKCEQSPQWRVLKVINFGGANISTPLTNDELEKFSIKLTNSPPEFQCSFLDEL